MNTTELMVERIRSGKTRRDIANALEISYDAYRRKEAGLVSFNPDQIIVVATELGLTAGKINLIFFDMKLPIGNPDEPYGDLAGPLDQSIAQGGTEKNGA